jgi:hypothetical protein
MLAVTDGPVEVELGVVGAAVVDDAELGDELPQPAARRSEHAISSLRSDMEDRYANMVPGIACDTSGHLRRPADSGLRKLTYHYGARKT